MSDNRANYNSDDPRVSTRRWSNAKLYLTIFGMLAVFAVAGSVYFFMADDSATDDTPVEESAE